MLEELRDFMNKHKVTIVRSASSGHKLVISHDTDDGFVDYIFDEEIGASDILHKRYTISNI